MQIRKFSAIVALITGLGGMLGAAPAFALVTIAADDFNSYAVGALNGNNGGSGWGGAWVDAGTTNANVVATVGADTPMSGNAVRITGNDTAVATRALADALSGNIIVRFDFQFDAGAVTNNDFLGLWFGNSNGPNIGLKANCGTGDCTFDIFARTSGSDAGGNFQNVAIGQSYSIMGYLQKTGVSTVYNRFDLWVDPTADEIATLTGADAFDTGASSISSFSQIGFRTANLSTSTTAPVDALLIDNLSISRVPEPGTLALFGLALAGIAVTSRRRKA
jgi:hypothetical protein